MSLEVKYGFGLGILMFLWTVVEYLTGFHTTNIEYYKVIAFSSFIVPVIGIPLGLIAKKKQLGDFRFPDRFRSGIIITVVFMLVSIIGVIIYFFWVNPEWGSQMANYAAEHFEEMGYESPVKASIFAKEHFNVGNFIKQSMIGNLIVGTVVTAVATSIITR